MSGPIIRKYGFANFEKIFGERPVPHGSDDPKPTPDAATGLPADLPHPPAEGGGGGEVTPNVVGAIDPDTEFGATAE